MIRSISAPHLTYILTLLPDPERYTGDKYFKVFVPIDLPINSGPLREQQVSIECNIAYFHICYVNGRKQWALRCVLGEPV